LIARLVIVSLRGSARLPLTFLFMNVDSKDSDARMDGFELSLKALRSLIASFEVRLEALPMLNLRFTVAEAQRARFTVLTIDLMRARFSGLVIVDSPDASTFRQGVTVVAPEAFVAALVADMIMSTAVQKLGLRIPSHLLDKVTQNRRQELLNLGVVQEAQEPEASGRAGFETGNPFRGPGDRSAPPHRSNHSGFENDLNTTPPPCLFGESGLVRADATSGLRKRPQSGLRTVNSSGDVNERSGASGLGSGVSGLGIRPPQRGERSGVSGLGIQAPLSPNERSGVSGLGFHQRTVTDRSSGLGERPSSGAFFPPGSTPSIEQTKEFLRETSASLGASCPESERPKPRERRPLLTKRDETDVVRRSPRSRPIEGAD